MDSPLVSLIIPSYNGEKYLGEALASAVSQTYTPLEIIVVDDGSTDGSIRIAESFQGVRVIRKENGGVSSARNRGIEEATGGLFAFLDQDDIQHPDKTARQVAALGEDSGAGFALCHKQYRIEAEPPRWFRGPKDGTPVAGFVPSCWLVRRETFREVGIFDKRFRKGADYDWLSRAKDLSISYLMLPEVLVTYRIHGTNDSGNAAGVKADMLQFLRESVHRRKGVSE
jgi:glycosyltransferase involved in cell wall biosynthesis